MIFWQIYSYLDIFLIFEFSIYRLNKVNSCTKGGSFGELALINNSKKRSATIIAQEDTFCGVLDSKNFNLLKSMYFDHNRTIHSVWGKSDWKVSKRLGRVCVIQKLHKNCKAKDHPENEKYQAVQRAGLV